MKQYQDKNTHLYILGDWFNAWIGDDYTAPWLDEIVNALQKFTAANNQVYFQVGNRDFALGQKFLKQFNGILLPNVYTLNIQRHTFRLEHGDALCTDDVAYQRFRKVIRNPILLGLIKRTPLSFRQKLANGFRKKSSENKQLKSYDIMDVNAKAVENVITEVDYLIHGHTHRPEIHQVLNKQRIVLGDWRTDAAWILEINEQENSSLNFKKWTY